MTQLNSLVATPNKSHISENAWTVSENDIYQDLELLMDDIFRAKMVRNKNYITLCFDNGQKFTVTIKSV